MREIPKNILAIVKERSKENFIEKPSANLEILTYLQTSADDPQEEEKRKIERDKLLTNVTNLRHQLMNPKELGIITGSNDLDNELKEAVGKHV